MKVNFKILVLSICSFLLQQNFLFAQDPISIQDQKQGRFYTTEGYEVKFKFIKENGDILIYKNKKGKILSINKNEILRIDAQTGNEAFRWGAVSLGTGLIGSALGAIAIKRAKEIDGGTVNKKDLHSFIIGYTAFFTTIGTLIGASKKKYRTVYDNPTYSSRFKNWQINATSIRNKPAIGLTIRF